MKGNGRETFTWNRETRETKGREEAERKLRRSHKGNGSRGDGKSVHKEKQKKHRGTKI